MKINQLKAGVGLSYISVVLGSLISIVYTPVMLRLLGQSEYGLYTLAGSVVAYLNILNFGLESSYIYFYSRYKVKQDSDSIAKLNGMFFVVFGVISLIALGAGGVLTANADLFFQAKLSASEIAVTQVLMAVLVMNVALSLLCSVFTAYITANEQYVFHRSLGLVKMILNPILSLIVLLMGYRSIGMVVITVCLNATIDGFYVIFCKRRLHMQFCFAGFDWKLLREIFAFSSLIFINIIVDQINWNVDKFLLGIFQGAAATAIYGLAAQLQSYYQQFSTTISSVFVPRVHNLIASEQTQAISDLFISVGRVQFLVMALVCSGFVFFGQPFVLLWGGKEYADSYFIALLLMVPVTVPLIQNIGIEVQRAKNIHKFRSYVYLGIAILNVLLSIPLVQKYSGIGCALGTAISLVLGNIVIMNWFYYKRCDLDIPAFWRNIASICKGLFIPILLGNLLNRWLDLTLMPNLAAGITVYTAAYMGSMWLFGMNVYEKESVRRLVKKITKAG